MSAWSASSSGPTAGPTGTDSGPGQAPNGGVPQGRWRRWKRALLILLVLAAIAAPSWLAYDNYRASLHWHDQYLASEADNEALESENATLETDLATTQEALATSEDDVADLERRVANLANEKAQVEDEREYITAMSERLTEVAVAYDGVATDFQLCRQELNTFSGMMADADYYFDSFQWYLVEAQARATDQACETAERNLYDLRTYMTSLLE